MKRITAIILSVCLCLIAAGCGGAPEGGAGSGGTGMNTEQDAEHASGAGQNTEQGAESGHLMVFDEGRGGITRKSPSVIRYVASASLDHWGRIPLHFDLEKFMVPGTIN